MKLIDRWLLRTFFKAWTVCFVSLVSLYLVIDLFSKLDEFLEAADGATPRFLKVIAIFYSSQVVLIFDRLWSIIVLLAAMFTIAWLQRNNELLPLLSAGISTRRVLRPVFLGTLIVVGLSTANREWLMPRLADRLQHHASDPEGAHNKPIRGAYEPNDILISGQEGNRQGRVVHRFTCTIPEKIAGTLCHITAERAYYIPKGPQEPSGGWLLSETTPSEIWWKDPVLEVLDTNKFFLRTERVDFDMVTRNRNWYQFASTWDIFEEMQKSQAARLAAMAVQLHLRLTLPLLTLLMVLMGVAVILRDQSRNVFLNAGLCLLLSAVFYGAGYFFKHLGEYEYLSPPLAAWLPVLLFGPPALTMLDAIHT
jgi:lipopolysaccharide export system permease protein